MKFCEAEGRVSVMSDVYLTRHGCQRIKERTGIGKSKRKAETVAQKAYERGVKYSETKGNLRKYLDQVYEGSLSNNVRVYAGKTWLFKGCQLITVMTLPSGLQLKIADYIREENDE